ncbi:CPBP family intramembrane glutamic endopeptidase [Segetibacter sp.]|uniref:CPBP family intramembrane glutamic endopeptidase n=1 Tax=Segetibacter sp. TaxID=2231182 RepID=UPI002639D002|nr:CPBP family intramembrane glutamic endopeptidase [Segetibacter sp.]MCW3079251.1 family intrarane metalloprotease [Segetibacter sp.]
MEATHTPVIKQGWIRAVVYVMVISLIVYTFQVFGDEIMNQFKVGTESGDGSILNFGILYGLMGLTIFITTWLMRRFIDRRSFQSLGFSWNGYSNEAGLGFFGALAILGIGSLILVATGYISFISATFNINPLLLEVMMMIIVAFVEELLFRGYILNNLLQSINKWVALAISAVLFALFHEANPDVTVFAIVNILLAGILLGLNYIFTKNLWFGICFHFAWNYFQGPVLGYDVSGLKLTSILQQTVTGPEVWTGGPFGFEGSLLCPLLFVVAIAIFAFLFLKRYQPAAV